PSTASGKSSRRTRTGGTSSSSTSTSTGRRGRAWAPPTRPAGPASSPHSSTSGDGLRRRLPERQGEGVRADAVLGGPAVHRHRLEGLYASLVGVTAGHLDRPGPAEEELHLTVAVGLEAVLVLGGDVEPGPEPRGDRLVGIGVCDEAPSAVLHRIETHGDPHRGFRVLDG